MKVYPNVDIYKVTKRNHKKNSPKKLPWKSKHNNLLNTKRIPKYKLNGSQVLHFAQNGGCFAPMNFRQLHDCCRLCCTLSLYKNRIAGFQGKQSCEILFIAYNMRCILHQSCPKETQIVSPMRNPVFQALTLYASSRQSVGLLTVFTGLHGRNTYNCGPCGM